MRWRSGKRRHAALGRERRWGCAPAAPAGAGAECLPTEVPKRLRCLLRKADKVLSHAEDGLNLIAAAAVFFLMFVGVAQIVGRTIFDFAIYGYIDWIEQASSLFAFLGIAYAQRLGSHIGMDLTMGWRPALALEDRAVRRARGHRHHQRAGLRELHQFPARLPDRQFDHGHPAADLARQVHGAAGAQRAVAAPRAADLRLHAHDRAIRTPSPSRCPS